MTKHYRFVSLSLLVVPFLALSNPVDASGNIVSNGSFELGPFVANNSCNPLNCNCYESLVYPVAGPLSWSVLSCNSHAGVAWGMYPTDCTPAAGVGFVDLAGCFNPPTTCGIQQNLNTLLQQYVVAYYSLGSVADVQVGPSGSPVSLLLHSGTPQNYSGSIWTPKVGVFNATSPVTVLTFYDASPGDFTVGVDSVSVTPMGESTGACCFPDGSCLVMDRQNCISIPGTTYIGDGVSCSPSPCGPTPVETTNWGRIKSRYLGNK